MASDLLNIASSGVKAARAALDLTAQNISNASTAGYVRRSVRQSELAMNTLPSQIGDLSLNGVRIDGITRNVDVFRQGEARRTASDAARSGAVLSGLQNTEAAIANSGLFDAMTGFEGAMRKLATDPVDPALRAATLEQARTVTRSFGMAAQTLDSAAEGLRFEAAGGIEQVNTTATELARVNLRLSRSAPGTGEQVTLMDQRDGLLQKLSGLVDIHVTLGTDQVAQVKLGNSAGLAIVSGGTPSAMAMTTAADGTVAFTLNGTAATPAGGSLAGKAQTLVSIRDYHAKLDGIANDLRTTINTAQTAGVALDGTAGQPLFSGSGAAGITLALNSGAGLATAPAGAGANSRDGSNLAAMRTALDNSNVAKRIDGVLFEVSSAVANQKVTSTAFDGLANAAQLALEEQSGVDLEQEATNLIRYQQAFQACGRAMQVANTCFDTLMGIR